MARRLPMPWPMPERMRRPVLRFGSSNVNGLTTKAAVDAAAASWRRAGFQVVFVQEPHLTFHTRTAIERRLLHHGWVAYISLSLPGPSGRGRGGTAILIRRELLRTGVVQVVGGGDAAAAAVHGPEGRYTALSVRWCGHRLHLCSIYLPSGDPTAQRHYITNHLKPLAAAARAAGCQLLWGGDFNFVPSPPHDRLMAAPAAAAAHPDVGTQRRWEEELPDLIDAWRHRHPARRAFTYVVPHHASRLDRFYVSAALVTRVAGCTIGRLTAGDHRPVSITLAGLCPSALGPHRPRVRLGFLTSNSLVQELQTWLDQELAAAPTDHLGALLWWPSFKSRLAERCAALHRASRQLAQGDPQAGDALAALHARLDGGDESVLPDILAARQQFAAALAAAEAEQALRRRQAWVHAGERPGPALSRRFQPPKQERQIAALRNAGGGLLTSGTACAQRVARYWAGVSAQPATDPAAQQEVLQALAAGRRLGAAQAVALGAAEVTEAEVARALRSAPPGRSPGLDGIPVELYRRYKDAFIPILARLYTAISTLGQVPTGFTDGLITILYKAGDRTDPANYRPITLLCTDYRLYAKVLALRLNPCLADVIDQEQTAFVPGRRIGENVLALQCLPELLRRQRRWAIIIFCDFRKAYDTLDRGFLLRAMATLGVGEGFLALVRLLLADTRARATVNRWVSTPEASLAGVRQGCPLAPLLYLFVAQALLCLLRARGLGIDVAGQRLAAMQFADDAEALLPSLDDIPSFLSAMATFGDATGQRLNVEKTKVLPVGAVPSDLPPTAHGLQVVSEATSLGVTFGSSPDPAAAADRWQQLLEGAEASYGRIASLRRFSIFGRGFASAAYGVSRLLYRAEFSGHPPAAITEALQRATSKLVGRGLAPRAQHRKFAGVAGDMLAGRPAEGGFGALPWLEHISARHAWWGLQLLLAPAGAPWLAIARSLLAACCGDMGGHGLGLLYWPATESLPGAVALLPQPLHRLHAALASLPRPIGVDTPVPGPWCWAAPLWGNPFFISAEHPDGIDHSFLDFAAAGIATLGQLLHLRQALEAVPSQGAYHMVWVAQLRRSYAFAQRYVAAERIDQLVAALPPGWVHAAEDAAAELAAGRLPPPELSDAMAAMIPCLAWRRAAGAAPLTLRAFTVREGTALLTAPQRRRRLQSYFTPFAVEAAGAAHDGSGQEVAALLRRLWRLRCDNGLKEPFWLLAHDGLPTAARLRTTCKCGAAAPCDRLHHYWSCPVAAAVIGAIAAAAGRAIPRHAVWLCRTPPGIHAGVWDLVCLAAIAAMDHGRRTLYALSTGPPPEAPLSAIAGRSACARFWSHLTDFMAFSCAPPGWRNHCPTGHPFIHVDPATNNLAVHCPAAEAPVAG